jgi:hypothetical protein
MAILVSNKKHYLTRFLPFFAVNLLIGLAPLIIGLIGARNIERTTGELCHGGNCFGLHFLGI